MTETVTIVGWGDTLDDYTWSDGDDLCVLSGAIYHVPSMPQHWVAFDRPEYYHTRAVDDVRVPKHVNAEHIEWRRHSNVHEWTLHRWPLPQLYAANQRVNTGVYMTPSSILAAVQIMAQIGYRRMRFVGCDFRGGYGGMILQDLRIWHPHFRDAGIEWCVVDPRSAMSEFCDIEELIGG